jgi:Ras GTPase-activating-like protein IQGAP2/3
MMPMNVPPPPPPPLPAGTSEASASIVLDFQQALDLLSVNDSFAQAEQVVAAHENLEALRAQISQVSRQNFILERELGEIDQKIGLLIQNRITAQEVVNSSASLTNAATTRDVLAISRTYYENLLFLLQSQPHYLSVLIRLCDVKQAASLVQTVIFDLFGDQYDPRQERLLLSMFTHLLRSEFDACIDMGSFLRANSCTTQMLSAYARRGHGTTILRNTLADNLQAICSRKDFNLEINPLKVYQDYVQDTETKTGQKCTLPPCETAEQASQLPEIAAICAARLSQLLQCCSELLTRIVDGVESIPYGMRYIAKQLLTLGKVRFPDAGRKELDSLVGGTANLFFILPAFVCSVSESLFFGSSGYIYLRYFNPVIVTPDGLGFIRDKPSKIMRRNLILIAKVLQNLSNGLLFGEKEEFMVQCNGFIQANASRLSEYWKDLVKVDLDHELGV